LKENVRKVLVIAWVTVSFAFLVVLLTPCMVRAFVALPGSGVTGAADNGPYPGGLYCGVLVNMLALRVFLGSEIVRNINRCSLPRSERADTPENIY